jgi:hypothetical protein
MAYDSQCYTLAETFIDDEMKQHPNESLKKSIKTLKQDLAQAIQDTIEDFLEYEFLELDYYGSNRDKYGSLE